MRTLLGTVLVGLSLAAAPALAQQHPWVPNGIYIGNVPDGAVAPAHSGGVHRGDIVDPARPPAAKAATGDRGGDGRHSRHAAFSFPRTP